MAPSKMPWWPGLAVAEQILDLVAKLRYYLGGESYTPGRYNHAHTMLFVAEQSLRALDLDGEGLLVVGDEVLSLRPSEVMYDLDRAMWRLSDEVESMEAAVKEAGAGGRNGGAAAAAQRAAAWWLDVADRLPRLVFRIEEVDRVCSHGKYVLEDDAARRRKAELEQPDRDLAVAVPQGSVENAKQKGASKWRLRIRRLFRRNRPSN